MLNTAPRAAHRLLLAPLFLALLHPGPAAGASTKKAAAERPAPVPDRAEAQWREGPIRYIITSEEDREYKQLGTDKARARFIERFWARRDPDHRTLLNEYRIEFWKRVAAANGLFVDSTKPGWKTDMGRFYILLGPPDDRDTTLEQAPTFSRTGLRGVITWRYSHSPDPRVGTGVTIVFTRDPSGEYRATTDPAVVQRALDSAALVGGPDLTALGIPLPELPARLSELQIMLDLGKLERVPDEDELLTEIVTAQEFFGAIPFSARYDYFAGANGNTIVAATLNLHPDPLDPARRVVPPDYLIVGRLAPDAPSASPAGSGGGILLHEAQFSPSSHNVDPTYHGPYIYQTVVSLPPGRYGVSFAAYDPAAQKMGSYSDMLEVPSFSSDTLSLSSLCLSESIEPVSGPAAPGPYIIGHLKVTPRLIPAYHNGETFAVYYQVYSAAADPASQAPRLDIEYQFYVNQSGGYVPIGRAIHFDSVGNAAQGWSFPLRDWPSAEFKLRVTVTDALTGQVASREVTFRVL